MYRVLLSRVAFVLVVRLGEKTISEDVPLIDERGIKGLYLAGSSCYFLFSPSCASLIDLTILNFTVCSFLFVGSLRPVFEETCS